MTPSLQPPTLRVRTFLAYALVILLALALVGQLLSRIDRARSAADSARRELAAVELRLQLALDVVAATRPAFDVARFEAQLRTCGERLDVLESGGGR